MKKIVLVFLFICFSNLKTTAQEYSELYSGLDSISKSNVGSNFYRILRMLNYEYNQINDSLTKEERIIIGIIKIDSYKKFKFVIINEENKDIEELLNNLLLKAPPFPIENFEKGKDLEYLTVKFDLKKYNYEGEKFNDILIRQKEENKTNRLEELDLYPSYGGKPEKFSDKEKALVLSVNKANDPARKYKEVFISLGGMLSKVYRTEVSLPEYLAYTTEESEKVKMNAYAEKFGGDIRKGIAAMAQEMRNGY